MLLLQLRITIAALERVVARHNQLYGPERIRSLVVAKAKGDETEERRKIMNDRTEEDDRAERKRVFLAVTHCC